MPTLTVSDHRLMLSTVKRGTNTMEIEKSEFFDFFRVGFGPVSCGRSQVLAPS